MLLTDWPLGVLSKFWADHSVLSAVLSSLLLVGVGFLAFEVRDTRVQSELDDSVTAAGMGGIVDHVVDIEVALALAAAPTPPDPVQWGDWSADGRPLRWLRDRHELLNRAETGGPSPTDPRHHEPPGQLTDGADSWRMDLLDQCVRRVIGGLRDWAPVLGRSRNGQAALVDLGKLRNELLKVQAALVAGRISEACRIMARLRRDCRVIALALEMRSGVEQPRAEVLRTMEPFNDSAQSGNWLVRTKARLERDTWKSERARAENDLIRGPGRS
ncbi:hypothetical protein B7435_02295 [Mycolicibacterium peregrinum]|uniref:hypothetical protein n=1 Tax=Mycolicibacterium peregrinum TaxID=43304 RepID=UPI0006D78F64|nr:hypothetical protein [Mycolicibacterium peregrinum]MCV7206165.1 hypothetical protein [Mycolicibacterium peregrinum]ORW57741.1 hypothetical protein AWC21_18320 [Mycolicibacterium peregrinum]OWM10834.1 hypothetical protein B7435_02295 [Mycolicibacterium peregrinum]